jgi:hypothetical protein
LLLLLLQFTKYSAWSIRAVTTVLTSYIPFVCPCLPVLSVSYYDMTYGIMHSTICARSFVAK